MRDRVSQSDVCCVCIIFLCTKVMYSSCFNVPLMLRSLYAFFKFFCYYLLKSACMCHQFHTILFVSFFFSINSIRITQTVVLVCRHKLNLFYFLLVLCFFSFQLTIHKLLNVIVTSFSG